MRKDVADLFAAEGEGAKERLEELKARGVDAFDLAISELQERSTAQKDKLKAYKFAKEHILPLLLRLDDESERDAAIKDVARKLKLTTQPLRKALAALEESEQKETEQGWPTRTEELAPQPGTERYERAVELLRQRRLLGRGLWVHDLRAGSEVPRSLLHQLPRDRPESAEARDDAGEVRLSAA